ncbi:hypothetical protein CDL15_Pgr017499 [Punica granatum]|uniref:Uncharacterized protein n=1 Tax=Punica granatum TaxID=22663 RepID=A0A218WZL1_PUNGR|nr:hypothetical protein CDL15_Pgr017499 [Punica granatum]
MFYLASGYEERVEEVFESRVTWLNAWNGAQVQRMHARARMGTGARGRSAGAREHARWGVWRVVDRSLALGRACERASGTLLCVRARGLAAVRAGSLLCAR